MICVRLCGGHADWFKIKGDIESAKKKKKKDRQKKRETHRERERDRVREILTCGFPFIVCIETCISWGENRCTFYLFIIHASLYIMCALSLSSIMKSNVSKWTSLCHSLSLTLSFLSSSDLYKVTSCDFKGGKGFCCCCCGCGWACVCVCVWWWW